MLWSPLMFSMLLIAFAPTRESEEAAMKEELEIAVEKVREWTSSLILRDLLYLGHHMHA